MAKNRTNKARKIIAIAGPTASGKSMLANKLARILGKNNCLVISQDNYYKDWSRFRLKERKKINFDHLNAFDFKLLLKDFKDLRNDKITFIPRYDFVTSCRRKRRIKVIPKPVVIFDGLTPFAKKELRGLFDLKIYIDIDNATCLARRIKRDIKERGDTIETVCARYFKDVLPMQKKYVEPQRKLADIIINRNRDSKDVLKRLIQRCRKLKN